MKFTGGKAFLCASALVIGGTVIGTQLASGATAAEETVFVPIAPCRLVDTRPGDVNVGPRDSKIGAGQEQTFTAWGTGDANSLCDIPNTATAVATNTTAVAPTARTFITLFPADVANPGTSNLNVPAGATPTPNAANVPLSSTGQFKVFNNAGDVHVLVDVNGYYQPSTSIGATGPAGADGAAGLVGPAGADLANPCIDPALAAAGRFDIDPCRELTVTAASSTISDMTAAGERIFTLNMIDSAPDTISVFSRIDGSFVETLEADAEIQDIATDGTFIYVLDRPTGSNDGFLNKIDPVTLEPVGDPLDLGVTSADAMAIGDGVVYVVHIGGVRIVNLETGATSAMTGSTGVGYDDIVFAGTKVFAYDVTTAMLHQFDVATGAQERVIDAGTGFLDMVYNGEYLFASQDTAVSVIDPSAAPGDSPFVTSISASGPAGALTTDGKHVYVTRFDNSYVIIDTTALLDITTPHRVNLPMSVSGSALIMFDGYSVWTNGNQSNKLVKHRPH